MLVAEIIVYTAFAYLVIGALFSAWFVTRGVAELDPAAEGAPLGFRFLIFWGTMVFWPLLLKRVLKGAKRPIEKTAHRKAAA